MKKGIKRLLKPFIWIVTQILSLVPSFRKVIKGLEGGTEVERLESKGEYDKARELRKYLLSKYPIKYLGPLWRSEGNDQLYNLNNYEKALEAFENAIICIEGKSYISAMQYGVTQPIQVFCGAATAAIYLSNKKKAKENYQIFFNLVIRLNYREHYQNQLNWLKRHIDLLGSQENDIKMSPNQ